MNKDQFFRRRQHVGHGANCKPHGSANHPGCLVASWNAARQLVNSLSDGNPTPAGNFNITGKVSWVWIETIQNLSDYKSALTILRLVRFHEKWQKRGMTPKGFRQTINCVNVAQFGESSDDGGMKRLLV